MVCKSTYSDLAFTRYCFTSGLLCTNQPSFHSPRSPALPTWVQYHCATIRQYTTPPPTSRVYAIQHTILVITISCKGQIRTYLIAGARARDRRHAGSLERPRCISIFSEYFEHRDSRGSIYMSIFTGKAIDIQHQHSAVCQAGGVRLGVWGVVLVVCVCVGVGGCRSLSVYVCV